MNRLSHSLSGALAAVAMSATALVGCSSSSSTPDTSDTGSSDTAMDMNMLDSTDETRSGSVNRCDTFEDHTVASDPRAITWEKPSFLTNPSRCMKIKAGQSVVWKGDPTAHPLVAHNGDTPTPVTTPTTDTTANTQTVTFSTAGNFGYECAIHLDTMMGVIQVVP